MNVRHKNMHPAEILRLKQDKTQEEFAGTLKLENAKIYNRYCRNNDQRLLESIQREYGVDLARDIMDYQNAAIRRLKKELQASRSSIAIYQAGDSKKVVSQPSTMDDILQNLKESLR